MQVETSRWRLRILVLTLLITIAGAGFWLGSGKEPPPITGPAPEPGRLAVAHAKAKKLPEYAELKSYYPLKPRKLPEEKVKRAIALVQHENQWIRMMALTCLGSAAEANRAEVAATVVGFLQEPDLLTRLLAMNTLGNVGAKERIPELQAFLKSEDSDERKGAKRALAKLGVDGE